MSGGVAHHEPAAGRPVGPAAALTDPLMTTSEAGRWWTSANTAEAMQGVLRPLDFTFQSSGIELGGRQSWRDFGVLRARDVYRPTDPNDCFMAPFFGRIGINVNFSAALMDQVPGISGAEIERALLGFAREGISYPGTRRRTIPRILLGGLRVRATQGRRLATAEPAARAWWAAEAPRVADRRVPGREALVGASDRFDAAMHLHLRTRFLLIMAQAKLGAALAEVGMPEALQPLTAGGGTAETEVAEDLWRLSRGELSREAFLAHHGYHGPNEGVLSSPSWREDARPVDLIAASLAGQDEGSSPHARRARTLAERDELEARFVGLASSARRARRLLRLARDATAWTEQGKLLTLLALDVGRAAARVYGDELATEGTLDEPGDLHYFTIHEVRAGLPANGRELVAFRRAKRDEYLHYGVPLTWEDTPEPIIVADQEASEASAGPLTGAGCSRGVYEGRARLVADPATDRIEPGEVLVCSTTDPSWMGIFVAAGAVVADIGGPTSHGAIVAREFGLPCVMGTVQGTRAIATGDLVRVDGTAGTVEIVRRA